MKKKEILKSLLNLLSVIPQYEFATAHKTTQYFNKPIHLFLLYAHRHTLIYYPSHLFCSFPRENPFSI